MVWKVLRLCVAAGVLALLFRRIPLESVIETLTRARPHWLIAAWCAALAGECLAAVRLAGLARAHGLPVPIRDVLALNLAARLYALALPAGNAIGMALRIHRLGQERAGYGAAASSVVLDRVAATFLLVAVGVSAFWIDGLRSGDAFLVDAAGRSAVVAMVVVFAGLSLAYLVYHRRPLRGAFRSRRPRLPGRLASAVAALESSRLPFRETARAWIVTLGVHALGILSVWLLAQAIGLSVSPITLAWVRSAALLVVIVPVSLAGLGLREGAFVLLLGAHGVGGPEALGLSLLVYVVTVFAVGLLGGLVEVFRALR